MKQKLLPYVKKIGIAFAITYALFIVLSSLAFQFYIKPNLNNYKSKIEALASQSTGQTIKINSLEGRWDFINPEIALNEVLFYDNQNNIYKQYNLYEIRDQFNELLYEVRQDRGVNIDFSKAFNNITA